MTHTTHVSEQLAHSTVRLEAVDRDGTVATGTGFFYSFPAGTGNKIPVIVTNRHVVTDAVEARFHLTLRTDNNEPQLGSHTHVVLPNFHDAWVGHADPTCDLVAIPMAPLIDEAAKVGKAYFFVSLDSSVLPTEAEISDLGAVEDVIMVGYPNGLWDSTNNLPIFRRGTTATHPGYDYNGRPEFMIDAACFPGSSGSPVFLYNVGSWQTRTGMIIGG